MSYVGYSDDKACRHEPSYMKAVSKIFGLCGYYLPVQQLNPTNTTVIYATKAFDVDVPFW